MRHLWKKLIGWMLCLVMAVGMLPGMTRGAKAAAVDSGTAGDEEGQVTLISTRAQLEDLAGDLDAHAILAADIDLDGSPWTPIGSSSAPFTGVLDGNGHKILNLTVDSGDNYVGLFGYIKDVKDENGNLIGGIVQNVTLEGGSITGNDYVGGLVGYNYGGTVENCYNTGAVTGRDYVGGLVGYNYGGTVENCYNTGAVTGRDHVGGVAGKNTSKDNAIIQNCYNTGAVTGQGYVGGVAGNNGGTTIILGKATVQNSYNIGGVSGLHEIGGIVGNNSNNGLVQNCYNTGDVFGDNESNNMFSTNGIGGVVGNNTGLCTVQNCYNTGCVYGKNAREVYVGGVVGFNYNNGIVTNSYYDSTICGEIGAINGGNTETVNGLTTVQMTGKTALANMEFSYAADEVSPWLTKLNGASDEGQYYLYYPHLKGFNYKKDGTLETDSSKISADNWPAKVEVKVTWDDSAPYTYDGSEQKPTVTKITVGDDTLPGGASEVKYYAYISATWEETTAYNPTSPGQYKMEYSIADEKGTKYFTILKPGEDYSVSHSFKPVDEDSYSETLEFMNAGDYKVSIFFLVPVVENGNVEYVPGQGEIITKGFKILQRELTIQAASEAWTYDGAAHSNNTVTITKGSLADGDELSATATGAVTFVSDTKEGNNPVSDDVKVMRGTKDVTGNYEITKVSGTLTITPETITITADSASKEYDGTALSKDAYEKTDLVSGDSIESITIAGSQTVVGSSDNVPSASVIKNAANQDVTSNYDITYANGTLEVTKKAITITAGSNTKEYDGTALTKDSVSAEGLATGDKIESITVTGSQTIVGKSDNTPSEVRIVNAAGEDVTKCYEITYENGTLEVTKKTLTITADSASKEFDKTALTKDSYTSSGLADGDKVESVTITGSQTMKGSSDNVPSAAKIVNAKGEDVTACYEITYKNGTLTVTASDAPSLDDDQKPAPQKDLKEDGKEQILVLNPANLPEGYTIEYSTDGGKTWKPIPTGKESGEYTIEVFYKADENHTDFFGDTLNIIIQGVYNQTESDGDWTKGSGKTYTFRIKKAFNDEVTYDNLTGVFVDGKKAESGKDYTPAKGSAIITFASDYLETLAVGEHMIRVVFKDGEVTVPLKILAAIATPTPAVDATPVTGDTANPFLWAAMVLLSMAGVAVMIERKRKQA